MESETRYCSFGFNRAKMYQLVLFPLNNGATNVYYVLVLSYIATFGNTVLGIATIAASAMVTVMRIFDAITDPMIGAWIDRTNGKFGKFRPFMVGGNLIMAISVFLLYKITPMISEDMQGIRYAAFIGLYAVWVIGYTFQTSVTRSAQTVLTNDPSQRPLFTVFNTIGSMAGMGVMQVFAPVIRSHVADYNCAEFYAYFAPIGICLSMFLTILAVFGIWEKDRAQYFGIAVRETKQEKRKLSEYIEILKQNKPMQRLMIAGAGCKFASAIATNMTVLCMLYGCMMNNYDGLYLPIMAWGYMCSVPFFVFTVQSSRKEGQKTSFMKYIKTALFCYLGVFVVLLLWKEKNPVWNLRSMGEINLYTVVFLFFFGIGYGACYATADMPIPMIADCSDYEMYRSGNYVPGIMGTLFSFVDKLISSFSTTIVGIAVSVMGLHSLPTAQTPYVEGMHALVVILFCVIPMLAWMVTLCAMKGYELTAERMKEIQTVNEIRKEAIAAGMTLEEAMKKFK